MGRAAIQASPSRHSLQLVTDDNTRMVDRLTYAPRRAANLFVKRIAIDGASSACTTHLTSSPRMCFLIVASSCCDHTLPTLHKSAQLATSSKSAKRRVRLQVGEEDCNPRATPPTSLNVLPPSSVASRAQEAKRRGVDTLRPVNEFCPTPWRRVGPHGLGRTLRLAVLRVRRRLAPAERAGWRRGMPTWAECDGQAQRL